LHHETRSYHRSELPPGLNTSDLKTLHNCHLVWTNFSATLGCVFHERDTTLFCSYLNFNKSFIETSQRCHNANTMSLPRPCCCCHRGRVHSVQLAPLPVREHPRSPPRNSSGVDEIRSPAPLAIEQDETHISYPRSPYPLSQTQMSTVRIGETVYKELLAVCTAIESLEDSAQSEPTIAYVHSHTADHSADPCEASSHSALRVRCR